MKNKKVIFIIVIILLAVLLIPVPVAYKDGGTKTYNAILYKIIIWHQIDDSEDGFKTGTEIHFFPSNFNTSAP